MNRKLLFALGGLCIVGLIGLVSLWVIAFSNNTQDFAEARTVQIPRGASFESALDSLNAKSILKNSGTFSLMARSTGWGNQIKAGNYEFAAGQSNYDILQTLRRGLQTTVRVVIPPGSRKEVIAAVVAKEMEFSKEDFLAALSDTALVRSIGTDTSHILGYLMPETYFFYWLTSPETVIKKVKESFDRFYEKEAAAGDSELSADDVITVASLVEWESDLVAERPTIAGVYLNRLRDGWRLDADPTVQYAILELEGSKRRLFFRDYKIEHPYNTYLFRGLPPGPITNPAPSAVRATLNPEQHRYYYFVARGDGSHTFSRTLREHTRAAQEYYRTLRERRSN